MAVPDARDFNEHVYFGEVPGKGWGIIAKHAIAAGTELLLEASIISILQSESRRLAVYDKFRQVAPDHHKMLLLLHSTGPFERHQPTFQSLDIEFRARGQPYDLNDLHRATQVLALFEDNAYRDGMEAPPTRHLCLFASFINHSCAPNAFRDVTCNTTMVRAIRDIVAEEEITVSYVHVLEDYHTRREQLQRWHFECKCPRCDAEADPEREAYENRLLSMIIEIKGLEDAWGPRERVDAKIAAYESLLQAADSLKLCDPRVGRKYASLANLYASIGNLEAAMRHQRRAIDIERNAYGLEGAALRAMESEYHRWAQGINLQIVETGDGSHVLRDVAAGGGAPPPGGYVHAGHGQLPGGHMVDRHRDLESVSSGTTSRHNPFGSQGQRRKGRNSFKPGRP